MTDEATRAKRAVLEYVEYMARVYRRRDPELVAVVYGADVDLYACWAGLAYKLLDDPGDEPMFGIARFYTPSGKPGPRATTDEVRELAAYYREGGQDYTNGGEAL